MPKTFIYCVNKLHWNEPNQFIFTDHSGHPIGDIDITGVDRDDSDSNNNQAPQDPPHKFQATYETEEEPVILYPNIDPDINHYTYTEQVQAPNESPEDPVQLPTATE